MTLRIHVDNQRDDRNWAQALVQAAEAALNQQGMGAGELTIVLSGDKTVQELNRAYRSADETTDVLSFPHGDQDPESGLTYLGDVVISLPQAERQAAKGGHSVEAELRLLTVHGVLHLLDHDHAEDDEKRKMWAAQAEILSELENEVVEPPA